MTDPRLDAVLREFLGAWQHDQAQGHTIANLRMEIHQVKIELEEARNENKLLRLRVERHGQRILAIEQKLEIDTGLDTGQHEVEDLKRLLAAREREVEERNKVIEERNRVIAEQKEEEKWWKRTSVRWFAAAFAWVLTTILTVAAAALLGGPRKGP